MSKIIKMVEKSPITKVGGIKQVAKDAGKDCPEAANKLHCVDYTTVHTPDWVGRDLLKPQTHNTEYTELTKVAKK